MTAPTIDLDAYLRRIGYSGPREATLDALRHLHARHTETLPFENLDPLLGRPVSLEASALESKLVRGGRGGYCFEHNLLFGYALRQLGFRVTWLAARVLWNMPEDALTPRSHMLLLVEVDGEPFIADVGFGAWTLTAPLRLETNVEQMTPHEPFRLVQADGGYRLQSRTGIGWRTLYRFDLEEQTLADYKMINYYLSTSPDSHFRRYVYMARPGHGRRYVLVNNQFSVHHMNGATERHLLTSPVELRAAMESVFRVRLPDAPELDATLARLAADAA